MVSRTLSTKPATKLPRTLSTKLPRCGGRPPASLGLVFLIFLIFQVFQVFGCATPDPRAPGLRDPERSAAGGWIEVKLRGGETLEGELIAAEATRGLFVLTGARNAQKAWIAQTLVVVELKDLATAKLYAYDGESFFAEGAVGMILSLPTVIFPLIWLIATAAENERLDARREVSYSPAALLALSRWARFPQGPPASLKATPRRPRALTSPARP